MASEPFGTIQTDCLGLMAIIHEIPRYLLACIRFFFINRIKLDCRYFYFQMLFSVIKMVSARGEDPKLFSSDPDPAQLGKKFGVGSDLNSKWKNIFILYIY